MGLTTLGEVLSVADRLPLEADLFMPFDEVWRPGTRCAIEPVDRYADEPAVPEVATRNGLGRALQVAQVQDIVDNARQQRPGASVEELVEAFLFYYDRDAFIDFSRSAEPSVRASMWTGVRVDGCNLLGASLFLAAWAGFIFALTTLEPHSAVLSRTVVVLSFAVPVAFDLWWRYSNEPSDSAWRFLSSSTGGAVFFIPLWAAFVGLWAAVLLVIAFRT